MLQGRFTRRWYLNPDLNPLCQLCPLLLGNAFLVCFNITARRLLKSNSGKTWLQYFLIFILCELAYGFIFFICFLTRLHSNPIKMHPLYSLPNIPKNVICSAKSAPPDFVFLLIQFLVEGG